MEPNPFWQADYEFGAGARGAFSLDCSAVGEGDLPGDGQAKADTGAHASDLVETLENARQGVGMDAGTLVDNRGDNAVAIAAGDDLDLGERRAVLDGVIQEVVENLLQPVGITLEPQSRFSGEF